MKQNKKGPCIENSCSRCCNPIKIEHEKGCKPVFKIPKDNEGNNIWKERDEI